MTLMISGEISQSLTFPSGIAGALRLLAFIIPDGFQATHTFTVGGLLGMAQVLGLLAKPQLGTHLGEGPLVSDSLKKTFSIIRGCSPSASPGVCFFLHFLLWELPESHFHLILKCG